MIKFDAVDFSERRSEEVISCFWRLVYIFNSLVFVYSDGPKMHVIMQSTASGGVLRFSGQFTSIEASDRKMYWLENVLLSYTRGAPWSESLLTNRVRKRGWTNMGARKTFE